MSARNKNLKFTTLTLVILGSLVFVGPRLTIADTAAEDTVVPEGLQNTQEALERVDRDLDSAFRQSYPNATAEEEANFYKRANAYRTAVQNAQPTFKGMQSLVGNTYTGSSGLQVELQQQINGLRATTMALGQFSGGAADFGREASKALEQVASVERTFTALQNLNLSGGNFTQINQAISGLSSVLPGVGQKLQPVMTALNTFSTLSSAFDGIKSGNITALGAIPQLRGAVTAINGITSALGIGGSGSDSTFNLLTGGTGTTGGINIASLASKNPAVASALSTITSGMASINNPMKVVSMAKSKAAEALSGATGSKLAAAGSTGLGELGIGGGCAGGAGVDAIVGKLTGLAKGVPVVDGSLINIEAKSEKTLAQICQLTTDMQKDIRTILTKLTKDDPDASAQRTATMKAARDEYGNYMKEAYVSANGQKGNIYPTSPDDYIAEVRANKLKNTIADLKGAKNDPLAAAMAEQLAIEGENASDEKARLYQSIGVSENTESVETGGAAQGGGAAGDRAGLGGSEEETPISKIWKASNNPDKYNLYTRMSSIRSELATRQAAAEKAAVDELYWGRGARSENECLEKDSEGNCRKFTTVTPSAFTGDMYLKLEGTSQVDETLASKQKGDETGIAMAKVGTQRIAAKQTTLASARSLTAGGANGGNITAGGTGSANGSGSGDFWAELTQTINRVAQVRSSVCLLAPSSGMCGSGRVTSGGSGGGDLTNGGGGGAGNGTGTPTNLPVITVTNIDTGQDYSLKYTTFSWKATGADSCTANGAWNSYGTGSTDVEDMAPTMASLSGTALMEAGDTISEEDTIRVYHPALFKASATMEKSTMNTANDAADFSESFVSRWKLPTTLTGVKTQEVTFDPSMANIEVGDRFTLTLQDKSISFDVGANQLTKEGLVAAVVDYATRNPADTAGYRISATTDGKKVNITKEAAADDFIPTTGTYSLECLNSKGTQEKVHTLNFNE